MKRGEARIRWLVCYFLCYSTNKKYILLYMQLDCPSLFLGEYWYNCCTLCIVHTAGLPIYVLFTAKCFPHKLKQLHTSRFHGAFSLDEISLKPGSTRHLIFVSKVNFLFSMKLWEERLWDSHHDSSSAWSAKLKLVQIAQGLVQFAQGISVFLLTTNMR